MEFGEKLQNLRKNKGLTQEELAENLLVSRTAVSKWESGRGYPSIDSIKEIAAFFSVTIDELLSSEKILSITEKESKQSIRKILGLLFGILDIFTVMLMVLPLYPIPLNGQIYPANLCAFTKSSPYAVAYWVCFLMLILFGVLKILLTQLTVQKGERGILWWSMALSAVTVMLLILTRQVYATIILFGLFITKGILYLKYTKL